MGETGYDMWMVAAINMARDKVHWIGQPVAAVAAVDVHTAAAALALIDVEYEPLSPCSAILAAMASEAPVLHEHVFTKGVEPRPRVPSNVCSRVVISRGDASAALADAHAAPVSASRSIPRIRAIWSRRSRWRRSIPTALRRCGPPPRVSLPPS